MFPELAVALARHLDSCPECSNRIALADPLRLAFAASTDPVCPPELADEICRAFHRSVSPPWTEIIVGSSLLAAAAALVVMTIDPAGLVVESAVWFTSVRHAGRQLAGPFSGYAMGWMGLAAGLALSSSVAARPFLAGRRVRP